MIEHPLLAALSLDQRQAFAARCTHQNVARGEKLLVVGQVSQNNYLISSGILRVDMPGKDGVAPTGFLTATDIVAESITTKEWVSKSDYVAVLPSVCWAVPVELCLWLLKAHPTIAIAVVERCLGRITALRAELRRVNNENVETGEGVTLTDMVREHACRRVGDRRTAPGPGVGYAGPTREHVSQTMRNLPERKLTAIVNNGYETELKVAQQDAPGE